MKKNHLLKWQALSIWHELHICFLLPQQRVWSKEYIFASCHKNKHLKLNFLCNFIQIKAKWMAITLYKTKRDTENWLLSASQLLSETISIVFRFVNWDFFSRFARMVNRWVKIRFFFVFHCECGCAYKWVLLIQAAHLDKT